MSHLRDKVAEFALGELSDSEMAEAKRHLGECSGCRAEFERFERTHAMLRSSPDLEPPRRVVFTLPARRSWLEVFQRPWLSPVSAAAAVALALFVAFRPAPAPVSMATSAPAPVVVQAQEIDYGRIVDEIRKSERVWIAAELRQRDLEIRRLRGELAYYESMQRVMMRETMENGSAIQLLAQHTETRSRE